MKNLEPNVYRQRLIIEGHYKIEFDGERLREYLLSLSKVLKMRIFSGPYSWPPDIWSNPEIELHDLNGFVAWTESGSQVYAWKKLNFFTVDIYSCKPFLAEDVIEFTKEFFRSNDLIYFEI